MLAELKTTADLAGFCLSDFQKKNRKRAEGLGRGGSVPGGTEPAC
jgi:hypothetical protein